MRKVFFLVCMFFYLNFVLALDVPRYQNLYVNDFAGILAEEDAVLIDEFFRLVEQNTSAEVVFVSMPSIEGEEISEYTLKVGEEWGVGKENKDNGIVILYVMDVNKIWVSTGYGVEGIFPDSKIGRFLDDYYVPFIEEGNVSEGIVKFSFALSEELIMNGNELLSENNSFNWFKALIIILLIIIIIIIISSVYGGNNKHPAWTPIYFPHGNGGGGGSFGGGGFGGGGAGR